MDKTIPKAAASFLDWIGSIEAPKGYNTIYGNNQSKLAKPITSMTLDALIALGPTLTKRFKSSAAGRYQFMNATLKSLKSSLKLSGREIFTPDLQDRLGFHLLRGRGYDRWAAGSMTSDAFALGIAKEWASIPVLSDMRGNSRKVVRGQSFYAGDSLNKSLVHPVDVESILVAASKLPKQIETLPAVALLQPAAPEADKVPVLNVGFAPTPGMETKDSPTGAAVAILLKDTASKLRLMNPEQAASLFRTGLQGIGWFLATKGIIQSSDWEVIAGPLLVAVVTIWGVWARSDRQLLASAAAIPAVQAVVVDEHIAPKIADFRVTTEEGAKVSGLL